MNPLRLLLALALAGCSGGGDNGTIVGNPGGMTVAEADALTFTRAEAAVTDIEMFDCDAAVVETVLVDQVVDLLDPAADYELPGGSYCAISVHIDTYEIDGTNNSDKTFELMIDAGLEISIESAFSFRMEGLPLLLQISEEGWIDPLDLDPGNTVIDSVHPLYQDMLDLTTDASALYVDSDENGELDPEEEDAGALAQGVERFVEEDTAEPVGTDDGCGCRSSAPVSLWLALPMMLALRRRR